MLLQSVCFTTSQILHHIQIVLIIAIIIKDNTIGRGFIIPSVYLAFHIISFFHIFFINHICIFGIRFPFIILHI